MTSFVIIASVIIGGFFCYCAYVLGMAKAYGVIVNGETGSVLGKHSSWHDIEQEYADKSGKFAYKYPMVTCLMLHSVMALLYGLSLA